MPTFWLSLVERKQEWLLAVSIQLFTTWLTTSGFVCCTEPQLAEASVAVLLQDIMDKPNVVHGF